MNLRQDSLVVYKSQPAVVKQTGDKKITIELPGGERASVRPKDVIPLHPGPSPQPGLLPTVAGDPHTAWEIIGNDRTTLAELAELVFGEYTPATAWAAWQLVTEGIYFEGTAEAIRTNSPAKVEEIVAAREAKAAEERRWIAFVNRATEGRLVQEDERYLTDVVGLALGRVEVSNTLRRLNLPQTRESAHTFLLNIGRWSPSDNPYPARLGLPVTPPIAPVNPLPDESRRDLTHLLALAIDDEGSGDPDDAISLDGTVLWVHVADVAASVLPDSPADVEARHRAANLYIPEGTIRMLPDEVTDRHALGLQPISPALSFALATSEGGHVDLREVVPSWVRVTRTTYEMAESQLGEWPFPELLAVTARNRARRLAAGAIEIDLPEVKIKVLEGGKVCIRPLLPLQSREMVRECMLMAGEAVGRFTASAGLPVAFTVQEPPLEGAIPNPPEGNTTDMAAMYAQRRLMQRSRPSTAGGRHAGLGLDVYVQATSPLRRYLDLLAHQQLRAYLLQTPPLDVAAVTLRIGTADAVAGAVRTAERLSNQHWTLVYLLQHPEWQGEGVVVEQRPGRDIILIPELAWEAENYHRPGRPLNSKIRLSVESVDLPNRAARFRVL